MRVITYNKLEMSIRLLLSPSARNDYIRLLHLRRRVKISQWVFKPVNINKLGCYDHTAVCPSNGWKHPFTNGPRFTWYWFMFSEIAYVDVWINIKVKVTSAHTVSFYITAFTSNELFVIVLDIISSLETINQSSRVLLLLPSISKMH